jgi:malate/lactate dehydrogenase
MSVAAVVGAGPIGSAVVQALAERARVREIRWIDARTDVVAGKALDIRQSGPVDRVDVAIAATSESLAAAGADVIVFADPLDAPLDGETGLAAVRALVRAGTAAPLLFADPRHLWLMEKTFAELKVPADRLIGTAVSAIAGAARALTGLELNLSGTDVQVAVTGRPPHFVVAWSSATAGGSLVIDRVPAHRLAAIGRSVAGLWPPGPHAIGVGTAHIARAVVAGSRRLHSALTILDGDPEPAVRGTAAMLPLLLGHGRILRRVMPSLSPQEMVGTGLFSTDRGV